MSADEGKLEDTDFFSLVQAHVKAGSTGALVIDAPGTDKGEHRAFFLKGAPQGALRGDTKWFLGQLLIQRGLIDEPTLARALTDAQGRLLGQVLIESQSVSQEDLRSTLIWQSKLNFVSLFRVQTGNYRFLDGLVHLTGFTPAPLTPFETLYQGAAESNHASRIQAFMASIAMRSVRKKGPLPKGASDTLHPAECFMVDNLLASFRLPGALAATVPLAPERITGLLFAMQTLGILELGECIDALPQHA